jgi:hypothetical protein
MKKNNFSFLNFKQLASHFLNFILVFSAVQFILVRFFAFLFTPVSFLLVAVGAFILTALIEAILLAICGKTVGGVILGIIVREKDSPKKLSFKQALAKLFFISSSHRIENKSSSFLVKWGAACLIAVSCWMGFTESISSLKRISVPTVVHNTVEGWKTFHSEEIGFTVDFPTEPYKLENTLELPGRNHPINFQEIKSQKDENTAYSVSYLRIPKKWLMFRSATLLNGALKMLTDAQYNSEIVDKQIVSHRRYPALDFSIKQGDEMLKGRLILVGSTLFRVMMTQPKTQEFTDFRVFVDSFKPVEKKHLS